ncbi:MAG: transporter substrate-binding domain-containing protein [Deltaproteobacteria bacterium]|jgi:ABC-type amino acid transport substrate-binding protein|nr:transporter substrate-binding domain-containing protein [Deltaproteobacteria bacterium]
MPKIVLSSILLLGMVGVLALRADHIERVIVVAVDKSYPPFSYNDLETNKIEGMDVEVVSFLCRQVGVSCKFVGKDFEDTFADLENGKIDMICAGPGLRVDMGSLFLSTNRYYSASSVFVGLKGAVQGTSLNDLQGLRIGVIRGSIHHGYIAATYKENVKEKKYSDFQDVMTALILNDIDLAFVDLIATDHFLRSDTDLSFDVFGGPVNIGDGGYLIVRNDDLELLNNLDNEIISSNFDKNYEDIKSKYFDFYIF